MSHTFTQLSANAEFVVVRGNGGHTRSQKERDYEFLTDFLPRLLSDRKHIRAMRRYCSGETDQPFDESSNICGQEIRDEQSVSFNKLSVALADEGHNL